MDGFDKLDLDLLRLMVEEPRAGVREYSRRLNIARNTAQARMTKLEKAGVIVSWRPQINLAPLGYTVMAFVHVHIAQNQVDETLERLLAVPELIEANTVSGEGDLLCRVVARDNTHFETVLQAVMKTDGVLRTRSEIVLSRRIWPRTIPIVEKMRTEI
ncbi:MAG: Lrp/AsnC family transcriptional regulator [Rhodococcus fascians]|uniref:Lrp/AsnC family transcriptional regulator n=1 Tax=Nocardiaceae TaxID=85025 RepID=UPI0005230D1A|nr:MULTISPECIES: Lrp/AsnC family transcriptional regulator [Rhodococcus]OZD11337.1 Lrp/AsnC family transcriptional regulator [Rhodococcus sp. 06-156-3C]OZD13572.1 Lrp/AsnC family transcriptional regulator [Rhodococcus sp. 06-156-4a]OZD22089.1 Lrp/AsnC family transcriptional regulator [Rhodococcus sp. 06-156-4C]OZD30195.1 Lrp/AsnC family transcriptional regulator [Rhodococcus sp. 06-156-3]OZD37602.1 Lrp/AsnC family transcriptional regulator [Rhodococcus sp. 06-156-3b]